MTIIDLAIASTEIIKFVSGKAVGGALEKVGEQVLLKVQEALPENISLTQEKSELLQAAVVSRAQSDERFYHSLETLVCEFKRLQTGSSQASSSGVNIQISGGSQKNVIGQQNNSFFR